MKDTILFGIIMTIIDTFWIRLYMLPRYKLWFNEIGLKMSYNYISIFLAYFTMILVYPLFIKNTNIKKELINAALIGAIIFALYAFTVCGIFPKYNLNFAFTEVIWGTILYSLSTYIVRKIIN